MFNIKWGIIPGAVAFALALAVSLIFGRVGFSTSVFRALLFAAVFFALGSGIWVLINNFIPDLLSTDSQNDPVSSLFSAEDPGSRINISLGETSGADFVGNAALPGGDADEVGKMSDLVSGAINAQSSDGDIDQNPSESYTGEMGEFAAAPDGSGAKNGDEEDFFMDFSSFMPDSAENSSPLSGRGNSLDSSDELLPERKVSGNKSAKLEGDFNPKEIAAGIRTVLEKDKKG